MRPSSLTTSLVASSLNRLTNPNSIRTFTTSSSNTTALKTLASSKKLFTTSSTAHRSSSSLFQKPHTTSNQNLPSTSTRTRTITTMSATGFLDLIKARRTYYALTKDLPIPKERVEEIVKESLAHIPSSFNSQSNRLVVLFGAEHDKLWDATGEILKAIVPADSWQATADRITGFKAGAATVLFYEDQDVVNGMQEKFALYADKFPIWAYQSDAMLQLTVWTALEAEGLGANLQHYNPLIDQRVASEWNVPASWKLNAQLVIGGRTGEAGPKDFLPIEQIYKSYGGA